MSTAVFVPPPHILPRSRTLPQNGKRVCSGCGDEYEPEEFRPKKRLAGIVVVRANTCPECHRKTMRRLRAKKKSKEIRSFVALSAKEQDFEKMAALVKVMWKRLGGIDGLSQAWKEEMERAKRHPESPARARCLLSFISLLLMVEQNRPPEPSLSGMSDEELAVQTVASMMQEQPETVAEIARHFGWTMVRESKTKDAAN